MTVELQHYLDLAGSLRSASHLPGWLVALRQQGAEHLAKQGLPTSRHEDWKYTNVSPVVAHPFAPVAEVSGAGLDKAVSRLVVPGPRLVFVDGRFMPELSAFNPAAGGLVLKPLHRALREEGEALEALLGQRAKAEAHPFTALNVALLEEGVYLKLAPGTVHREPVQLIFLSRGQGALVNPRVVVEAGAGSQAVLVERYAAVGPGASFTNVVTEVSLGAGARLAHVKVQAESEEAVHVGGVYVQQARDSRFDSHLVAVGGALARNEVHSVFAAEGGECTLNGLYVGRGTQHLDQRTTLDHAHPRCTSRELYKGVLDDKSRGTFHGKVLVRPEAQQTDARQTNRNLLLSESAQADARPQLEIEADDVKCAHGATVGRLDEQALFYLRARGIPREEAEWLLTHAFAAELVGAVPVEALREQVEALLAARLPGAAPREARA